MTRRERTRQLIELGGLVVKAGLVELTHDDRAVIFGGLLAIAANLSGDDRDGVLERLARRGNRAFALDAEMSKRPQANGQPAHDGGWANAVR